MCYTQIILKIHLVCRAMKKSENFISREAKHCHFPTDSASKDTPMSYKQIWTPEPLQTLSNQNQLTT